MAWAWRVAVAAVLALGSLFAERPANAGGSTFSFTWRYVAPGQEIHGRAQFSVEAASETGAVDEGPYFLYMLRGDAFVQPPVIPERAILLGPVQLNPLRGNVWMATISFVVPDVRPGLYTMSLCNDPCREQYVGDLMGSWVHVVATPEEARLRNLVAQSEQRVEARLGDTVSELREQVDALRAELSAAEATSGRSIRAQSEQLAQLAASASTDTGGGDRAGLWLAGWIVAAAIGSAWWISARRRAVRTRNNGEPPAGRGEWLTDAESIEELERVP